MVFLGADHQGAALQKEALAFLQQEGIRSVDCGGGASRADDYPDIARRVIKEVLQHPKSTGILFCGSGNGMAMAANRFPRIRAALAPAPSYARKAREDEDANVIVIPAWWTARSMMRRILKAWFAASPSHAARHRRRTRKLSRLPHA